MMLREESFVRAELKFGLSDVRRVQEWLCLRGFPVEVDGRDGPATQRAFVAFRDTTRGLPPKASPERVLEELRQPIAVAVGESFIPTPGIVPPILAIAERHLALRPRETGGQNRGPWVRLYMLGRDGRDRPWCAGFATTIYRQAAESIGERPPVPFDDSCGSIGRRARSFSRLSQTPEVGGLFLLRDRESGRGWGHVGIVVGIHGDAFETIEGNTNNGGGREGFEVERRWRAIAGKDFVRLG